MREAGLLEWQAAEVFVALSAAVEAALGPARARAFWKGNLLDALSRSLLKPLRAGALALYGKTPRALLKMAPQAWSLVGRAAGRASIVEVSERQVVVHFAELTAPLTAAPSLLDVWAGGAEACIAHLGWHGSASPRRRDLSSGRAEIDVEWSPS